MSNKYLRYPIPFVPSKIDKIVVKFGSWIPIYCPICGKISRMDFCYEPLRETCVCKKCKSHNRQRQIALIICDVFSKLKDKNLRNLKEFSKLNNVDIFSTEAHGSLHECLKNMETYTCSEYLGDTYNSGTYVNGIMHQDIMDLSFSNESFDLVISADVLEHVSDPYMAHREIHRVLKPGGRHIFSVAFDQCEFLDILYTAVGENGELIYIKDPWYHIDPIRPEGALVFKIFSIEMLIELRKIGFYTNMYHLYSPRHGIIGQNGVIFEAIKI